MANEESESPAAVPAVAEDPKGAVESTTPSAPVVAETTPAVEPTPVTTTAATTTSESDNDNADVSSSYQPSIQPFRFEGLGDNMMMKPLVISSTPVSVPSSAVSPPPVANVSSAPPVVEEAKAESPVETVPPVVTTSTTTAPSPPAKQMDASKPTEEVYQQRTAQVAAAGTASRWGQGELEKAQSFNGMQQAMATLEEPLTPKEEETLPEEPKTVQPSTPVTATTIPTKQMDASKPTEEVYQQRTAQVVAAGTASRWGKGELEQAHTFHGMQQAMATLDQPLPAAAPARQQPLTAPEIAMNELYHQRNQNIVAAAGASRWGPRELEKASVAAQLKQALQTLDQRKPVKKTLFQQRNDNVVQAGAASRWGKVETEKSKMAAGLKQALDVLEFGAEAAAATHLKPVVGTEVAPSSPTMTTTTPAAPSEESEETNTHSTDDATVTPLRSYVVQSDGFGMQPLVMPSVVQEEPAVVDEEPAVAVPEATVIPEAKVDKKEEDDDEDGNDESGKGGDATTSLTTEEQQARIKKRIEEMRQRANRQAANGTSQAETKNSSSSIPPVAAKPSASATSSTATPPSPPVARSSALPETTASAASPSPPKAGTMEQPEVLMVQNAASQMAAESAAFIPTRPVQAPPRSLLQRAAMGEVIRRNRRQSPTARAMSVSSHDPHHYHSKPPLPSFDGRPPLPFYAKWIVPEEEEATVVPTSPSN